MNKVKVIKRKDIKEETYVEILDKEKHHNHPIIKDENGTLRWIANDSVCSLLDEKFNLNDLVSLLHLLGYGKNSEVFRKLYRDMGYSLSGYWEIFYWEVNNEEADKYVPNHTKITKS